MTALEATRPQNRRTRLPVEMLLRRLFSRQIVVVGFILLAFIAALGIFADLIVPYDPQAMDVINRLEPPSSAHWFGTDEFGRDLLSRTIYGARLSLLVGLFVVVLASLLGTALGLIAGYIRHLDGPVMRLIDAMMAFPDILLAIALMAALGASLVNVVVALGIVYTPRIARIVRAATLVLREMPFVEAAEALGASSPRIVLVHLLPNLVSPIIVQGTFVFAYAILTEAALSFLGVGISPTTPTWGNMISTAQVFMHQADWLILIPGAAIALTVVSLQIVGDGLRDALDPRLRKVI